MTVHLITEREMLTNVLRKYRDLPCLWDKTHEYYSNKVKRSEAYTPLLKLYRMYEPKASLIEFKRKIENMRTTYKRLRIKMLKARAQGQIYKPSLWYYKELEFLDEGVPTQFSDYEQLEDENEDDMIEVDYLASESRSNSPLPTKGGRSNYVFLNEDDTGSGNRADLSTTVDQNYNKNSLDASTSAEFFGKTVGSQLAELQPLQRYVAEKLISEAIFYARLDKLSPESSISLNNE